MNALYRILHPIHCWAVKVLGWAAAFAMAILVCDVLLGVFTRFIMGSQTRWTEEVAIILIIWVSLLGAAVAYADNAHLGLDYIVEKFHPSVARLTQKIIHLIVLLFALYGLLMGGWGLVGETTNILPALGMAKKWVYLALPISGAFFVLFALHGLVAPVEIQDADSDKDLPID